MPPARPTADAGAPPEADDSQLLARLAALMGQDRMRGAYLVRRED